MPPMFGPFIFLISSIVAIGAFMYIIIMGPSPYHRNGCVGRAYKLLNAIPRVIGGVCCSAYFRCDQKKGREACDRCCTHTTRERNWFMVIFYIVLVWTVEYLYLVVSLPRLQASLLWKSVSWGLVLVSEFLYAMALFSDPGRVTPEAELAAQQQYSDALRDAAKENSSSHHASPDGRRGSAKARLRQRTRPSPAASSAKTPASPVNAEGKSVKSRFKYTTASEFVLNHRYCVDGMLYALASDETRQQFSAELAAYVNPDGTQVGIGQVCTTCHVLRPARSKHCSFCKMCVRRFDHHCPWINNDVAESTHRYFLGFLIVHAISCTWACLDLYFGIKQFFVARHAWGGRLFMRDGRVYRLTLMDYVTLTVNYQMLNACLIFFAFCIALVLYGFWGYQMSYVVANLTMNDLNKMDDVASFVEQLPSLAIVHREAGRVRARLQAVARRKPKALLKLRPPPETTVMDEGWAEGGKKNKAYRKAVKRMISTDLRGMYDRGWWGNLVEVFFPYSILNARNLEEAAKVDQRAA